MEALRDLKRTNDETQQRKAELKRYVTTLGDLRDAVAKLSRIARKAVAPDSDDGRTVAALTAKYVADPVVQINTFMADPAPDTAAALSDMVGMEHQHLVHLIQEVAYAPASGFTNML